MLFHLEFRQPLHHARYTEQVVCIPTKIACAGVKVAFGPCEESCLLVDKSQTEEVEPDGV